MLRRDMALERETHSGYSFRNSFYVLNSGEWTVVQHASSARANWYMVEMHLCQYVLY